MTLKTQKTYENKIQSQNKTQFTAGGIIHVHVF